MSDLPIRRKLLQPYDALIEDPLRQRITRLENVIIQMLPVWRCYTSANNPVNREIEALIPPPPAPRDPERWLSSRPLNHTE